MRHKFLEEGAWFAPKRFGYGAGLPIAWQGWMVLLAYGLAMTGIALALSHLSRAHIVLAIAAMLALTASLLIIAARRTRGGWRWRNGERG